MLGIIGVSSTWLHNSSGRRDSVHHCASVSPHCRHVTTTLLYDHTVATAQTALNLQAQMASFRCLLLVTFTVLWALVSRSTHCLAGRSAVLYKENQVSCFHSGVLCCPAILYLAWRGRHGSHDQVCVGLHNLWRLRKSYVGAGGRQNKQTHLLPLAYLFTAASDTEARRSLLDTWLTCSCQVSLQI